MDRGTYHIVPITTGTCFQRPLNDEMEVVNLDYSKAYEYHSIHPYLDATLSDIFSKIDLHSNMRLEASELNAFGRFINNEYFKSLLPTDFSSSKFDEMSCTKQGMTEFGFK
jgi:hypothetical protein